MLRFQHQGKGGQFLDLKETCSCAFGTRCSNAETGAQQLEGCRCKNYEKPKLVVGECKFSTAKANKFKSVLALFLRLVKKEDSVS
jgi:hypothetical protein